MADDMSDDHKIGRTSGGQFTPGAGGRAKGSKNKATMLREDTVTAITQEKSRRDAKAASQGIEGGWLATLSSRDFLTVYKQIIPKNIEMTVEGRMSWADGVALLGSAEEVGSVGIEAGEDCRPQ